MTERWCDPPEGWRYGFPRVIPDTVLSDVDLFKDWLRSFGYPEHLMGVAMRSSRFWEKINVVETQKALPPPQPLATHRIFRGKWHTIMCADHPKLIVLARTFEQARQRAEEIFGIKITQPEPEAA